MSGTVPSLSMIFMGVSCLIAFALPIGLLIYLKVKKQADLWPFFAGALVMLFFALILESLVHQVVLNSPAGEKIQQSTWLYALYGGFMAGLFEETGRYLAMRFALRKYHGKPVNAVMYGAGHGGLECIVLLGFGMISNLVLSEMINSGSIEMIFSTLGEDMRAQTEAQLSSLITLPAYTYLLGGFERISAMMLQIAMSILVWLSVTKPGRGHLVLISFLIHFFVDAGLVLLQGVGVPNWLLEVLIFAAALALLLVTLRMLQRQERPQ